MKATSDASLQDDSVATDSSRSSRTQLTTGSGTTLPKFGQYVMLGELGRGGMAEVFLALAPDAGGARKLVVLKMIRTSLASDPSIIDMFVAEAKVALRLNHPNIVRTHAIEQESGKHCIVMEYLEGRSLSSILRAVSMNLPIDIGVSVLADALVGLHYAHELRDRFGRRLRFVHRDVTPENIFVTYQGGVKVLDFGIAKAADLNIQTRAGVFKGKLRYSAPGRFVGGTVDRRADIFSVGVILWQLLTRRKLWSGVPDLSVMNDLANGALIPNPCSINPRIPRKLGDICMRALAYSPNDRYPTAAEFRRALEQFRVRGSVSAPSGVSAFMLQTFGGARTELDQKIDAIVRTVEGARLPPVIAPVVDTPRAAPSSARDLDADTTPDLVLDDTVAWQEKLKPRAHKKVARWAVPIVLGLGAFSMLAAWEANELHAPAAEAPAKMILPDPNAAIRALPTAVASAAPQAIPEAPPADARPSDKPPAAVPPTESRPAESTESAPADAAKPSPSASSVAPKSALPSRYVGAPAQGMFPARNLSATTALEAAAALLRK